MSGGLQQHWGLTEPTVPSTGSAEQANRFRSSFNGSIASVNQSLQYTAAYADLTQHQQLVSQRDGAYSAYQAAADRIDPTNPSVAEGDINRVLSSLGDLQMRASSLQETTERAVNAWNAREGEYSTANDQVAELEEWGHEKARTLRQIAEAIQTKINERKWREGLQALEQLLPKLGPIYEEYCRQKEAQQEYEPAAAALESRLADAQTCQYASLEPQQQELTGLADQMRQAAEAKDFVAALECLRTLETKLGEYETALADQEAKRAEYEQALAGLQPRLGEASQCQYEQLAPMQEEIVQIQSQMEEAAACGDYDRALQLVNDLSTKLDAYLAALQELEQARQEYESLLQTLQPRLAEAATCEYPTLTPLSEEMVRIQGEMEAAAAAGDFTQALQLATDLTAKLDEYEAARTELEQQREEYEQGLTALQPRLAEASQCIYPSLTPLQEELVTIQQEMENAAQQQDFAQALQLLGQLTQKVDDYLRIKQELEQQYQELVQGGQSGVAELKAHAQATHFTAEIAAAETQFNQAKSQGDQNQLQAAIDLLRQVVSTCSEIKTTMDLVATGLDRARAEEVADVSQALIDTGVDRAKALEVGHVMQTGGSGTVEDSKLVAAELAELPMDVIQGMRANGTSVVACRGSITDHRADLRGVQPRGWPAGSTWDTVPGVFSPDRNEVVIATRGHGTAAGAQVPATGDGHGSYDLVTHEAMHGYDEGGGGTSQHDDAAFQRARQQDQAQLGPYYSQPGHAGLEETYAESAARYYGGDPNLQRDWPHLYQYWHDRETRAAAGSAGGGASGAGAGAGGP